MRFRDFYKRQFLLNIFENVRNLLSKKHVQITKKYWKKQQFVKN